MMNFLGLGGGSDDSSGSRVRFRDQKGMQQRRGSSFWQKASPELGDQCSVRFDHASLATAMTGGSDWPTRCGPAVRLSSRLEKVKTEASSRWALGRAAQSLLGYGERSRRTVWLRLEKGSLVYEEPIYALSRVDLMVERVPSGGGAQIGVRPTPEPIIQQAFVLDSLPAFAI